MSKEVFRAPGVSIQDALARTATEMCDCYCKYPEEFRSKYKDIDEATEHMYEEACNRCPMIDLLP